MTRRFSVNIRVSSFFATIALMSVVLGATLASAIVPQPSTTVVKASPVSPSTFGQAVTFTATVTGGGPVPTGEVLFRDGVTPIFRATLDGGPVATFTTSRLAVGSHSITADYLGNPSYALSIERGIALQHESASCDVCFATFPHHRGSCRQYNRHGRSY